MYKLAKITLYNGKPTFQKREVVLPPIPLTLLVGKGEGCSINIHIEHLKYLEEEPSE